MSEKGWGEDDTSLNEAYTFFRNLTGIEVRLEAHYVGFSATEGTRDDLEKLDRWFEKTCSNLYWDEGEGKIMLQTTRRRELSELQKSRRY